MAQLVQLAYVSSAITAFTEEQLNSLLLIARKANREHNITGLLLYKDGNFMQLIEGEERKIVQLYANIGRDERHTGIILLFKEPAPQRDFPDWFMGFRNLASENVEGFTDFLSPNAEDKLVHGKAKTFFSIFKKS